MTSSTEPSVRFANVTRSFGRHEVLRGISFEVKRGEIVGLLGPSGSGKTTLVRMVAGTDSPTSGEVFVQGQRMPQLQLLPRIGYMAQSDALYGEISARKNMEFFGALYGITGAAADKRIDELSELVNLRAHLDRPVQNFSGGMKRRLSLTIALIHDPEILILDEPTVGIDPVLRIAIWEDLHDHAKAGTSILITTHVMDEVERCDEVAMLRDGKVIAYDAPGALKREAGVDTIEEVFLRYAGDGHDPPAKADPATGADDAPEEEADA